LFADVDEVNAVLQNCAAECIEVKYDPKAMLCPVVGCIGIQFPTKTRFQRHWEEKHRLQTRKFLCPIAGCSAEVRRRSDMRTHLKTKHERDPQRVEVILEKCQSLIRENRGYIDPGLFIYKGGVVDSEPKPLESIKGLLVDLNSKPESGEMPSPTPINSAEEPEPSPTPSNSAKQPESKRRKMSTEEYWNSRQPSRGVSTHTQTSWSDYASLTLPPLPKEADEIRECLAWVCTSMDTLGRARELLKRRLAEDAHSEVARERELRRKAEQRNRELEKELRILKERDELFLEE
jgi:hypothetical protein